MVGDTKSTFSENEYRQQALAVLSESDENIFKNRCGFSACKCTFVKEVLL